MSHRDVKPDYVGLELALDHPIWSAGADHELAADHGVSVAYVRERRRIRREDLLLPEIRRLALEVAALNGWEEPAADTIRTVLRFARLAALADRYMKSAASVIRSRLQLRRVG